jgi:NADH dehydrogenase
VLIRRGFEIVLIDRHRHHLFTPALYELAAIPREYARDESLVSAALIATREIIRGRPIRFVCDEFIGLDQSGRRVLLRKNGEVPYQFLVLALGAQTNYFQIPGLKEYSVPLKTGDDAVDLRNSIEAALAKAKPLRLAVGGAGASGVELAAELVNFVCALKSRPARFPMRCDVSFYLIEASAEILPGADQWIIRRARERLERLGVVVRTGEVIVAVSREEITLRGGERLACDILVWTGGVKGPEILRRLGLPLSAKDTLRTDHTLRLETDDGRIFAVGDNAWFANPSTGRALAWTVPVAEAEGRHVAREISRALRGQTPLAFRPRSKYPFILAVGRKYALADLLIVHLGGFAGWLIKQAVELRYLLFLLPWPRAFSLWSRNIRLYSSND